MFKQNLRFGVELAVCFVMFSARPLLPMETAIGAERLDPNTASLDATGEIEFYDARDLGIEGQAWTDIESPYHRLPESMKPAVRPQVWNLSTHSAGLCVRFVTGATSIYARWTLENEQLAMNHMPATGVSGLDLYYRAEGGNWRWLAVGIPEGKSTTTDLVSGLDPGEREYLLYLPLYNGVASLEIGIPKSSSLMRAAPRATIKSKPVVFYGTSITQGGCASRPGMCHVAILGRRLDRPVVNLGFSGNGKMDLEIARQLAKTDAAALVVDCLPNMNADMVNQRAESFIRTIRDARPTMPILLVEDRTYADASLLASRRTRQTEIRAALRAIYDDLVADGDANLAYLAGGGLLSEDGDDTVDGSHPTDLGFVHIADALQPALESLLQGEITSD